MLESNILNRTRRFLGLKTGLYLKLKRFTASASEDLRTAKLLDLNSINFVIDVGANTGQFAQSLYDFGYKGRVLSFEPVENCHQELLKHSESNPNWKVAERCAIGNTDGQTAINVSDASVFSSILTIKDKYVEHNPKSGIVKQEQMPIYRLDTILPTYLKGGDHKLFLKIDTQGYEKMVLEGASGLLKMIKGIKIEIPLYPIYENNDFTFYEIIDFLKKEGFKPFSFHVEGVDIPTGRVNTIDGVFFR